MLEKVNPAGANGGLTAANLTRDHSPSGFGFSRVVASLRVLPTNEIRSQLRLLRYMPSALERIAEPGLGALLTILAEHQDGRWPA